MATIGIVKIEITVVKKELGIGLAAAQKDLTKFNDKVLGFNKSLGLTSYNALKLTGKIIALGVAAGGAGAAGLAALAMHQAKIIDANGKLSDRLNISVQNLTGLQHAADLSGVSSELLTKSLEKLQKLLGSGDIKLDEALNQLGLSSTQLLNMDTGEAFKLIADGLNKVENKAVRAALEFTIFGKSGQALGPLLAEGSKGIEKMTEEAKLLNLTYSRFDAAQVESANDNIDRMQKIWSGVGNSIAIEFAPAITEATNRIMRMIEAAGGIKTVVAPYIEIAKAVMITLADVFDGFILAATAGFGLIQGAVFMLLKPISMLVDALSWVSGEDAGKGLREYVDQIGQNAKDTFNSAHNMTGYGTFARDTLLADTVNPKDQAKKPTNDDLKKQDLINSTTEYIAKLKEEYAAIGLTNEQKKIAELRSKGVEESMLTEISLIQQQIDARNKMAENAKQVAEIEKAAAQIGLTEQQKVLEQLKENGATAEQLAAAQAAQDKISGFEADKKSKEDMKKKAESILDSIKSPAQKYEEQLKEIQKLQEAGLLTDQQAILAAREAGGLNQSSEKAVSTTSLTAGSSEAFAAIDRARSQGTGNEIGKSQLTESKKQTSYLKFITERLQHGESSSILSLDFA